MTARRPHVLVAAILALWMSASVGAQEWAQARRGYQLRWPADHASHPAYKIEWWYYTGNLSATNGHRFGYQLTFFRVGVDPSPANPSRWAVRDLFMTHLAVTDITAGRHLVAERLNRAGVGWAGADTDRYHVWNEDWTVRLEGDAHRLVARDRGFGIDLALAEGRPPVAHGSDGFSQKGRTPGNASIYYSLTRMPTRGTLVVDGSPVEVEGLSWMDHEFGTTFLEEDQQGWDWFSLQLDDGTDVMAVQLRSRDASREAFAFGTIVSPDGEVTSLDRAGVSLTPGRVWRSPTSGAAYPIDWTVALSVRGLRLHVRAAVDGQELASRESTGVTYWEGAVTVDGASGGKRVGGRGYLEMTGYTGRAVGAALR